MHQYYVEQKIKTLADCVDPFEYKGINFKHWDSVGGWNGDAWLASKVVDAENFLDAINAFRRELSKIVPRIGYISQCFMTKDSQPWLVVRLDDNEDKNLLCFYSKEIDGVSLHFGSDELESLKKLEIVDDAVFAYLNESNLAGSHLANLSMLIIALESVAGEKKIKDICPHCNEISQSRKSTDKEELKNIINDEVLYKKLFGHGTGIRNMIFHGKEITPEVFKGNENMNKNIFKKFGTYFNNKYDSVIDIENITGPQRHFYENYETAPRWLSCSDKKQEVSLKDVMGELIIEREGNSMSRYFHIDSAELMKSY